MLKNYQETKKQALESWIPYKRGLRVKDCLEYEKIWSQAFLYLTDDFVRSRVISSEALFLAAFFVHQLEIQKMDHQSISQV